MNYSQLPIGAIFSCKVKSTYANIYIRDNKSQYHDIFTIQKGIYDQIIGCGEKIEQTTTDGYVPITLTDDTLNYILYMSGFIDENGNRIGAIKDTEGVKVNPSANPANRGEYGDNSSNQGVYDRVDYDSEVDEAAINFLAYLDVNDIVFVKELSIDCQEVSVEDVEVEDVEVENKKTNISDLIWIALGALALLL